MSRFYMNVFVGFQRLAFFLNAQPSLVSKSSKPTIGAYDRGTMCASDVAGGGKGKGLGNKTKSAKCEFSPRVILSQINVPAAEYLLILHNTLVSKKSLGGGEGRKKLKRGEWGGGKWGQKTSSQHMSLSMNILLGHQIVDQSVLFRNINTQEEWGCGGRTWGVGGRRHEKTHQSSSSKSGGLKTHWFRLHQIVVLSLPGGE